MTEKCVCRLFERAGWRWISLTAEGGTLSGWLTFKTERWFITIRWKTVRTQEPLKSREDVRHVLKMFEATYLTSTLKKHIHKENRWWSQRGETRLIRFLFTYCPFYEVNYSHRAGLARPVRLPSVPPRCQLNWLVWLCCFNVKRLWNCWFFLQCFYLITYFDLPLPEVFLMQPDVIKMQVKQYNEYSSSCCSISGFGI